jgi:hypothetical protein
MTGVDQAPYIKYNAKIGQWQVDERTMSGLNMIIDLENGESGWMRFSEGLPPEFHMVRFSDLVTGALPYPPRPPGVDLQGKPIFKRGFRLTVKLPDSLGVSGTVREWASASIAVVRVIDELHTAWSVAKQAGMVPVIKAEGSRATPGRGGAVYAPVLSIAKWVPRPVDLVSSAHDASTPSPVSAPASESAVGEPETFTDDDEPF